MWLSTLGILTFPRFVILPNLTQNRLANSFTCFNFTLQRPPLYLFLFYTSKAQYSPALINATRFNSTFNQNIIKICKMVENYTSSSVYMNKIRVHTKIFIKFQANLDWYPVLEDWQVPLLEPPLPPPRFFWNPKSFGLFKLSDADTNIDYNKEIDKSTT